MKVRINKTLLDIVCHIHFDGGTYISGAKEGIFQGGGGSRLKWEFFKIPF